MNFKERFGHIPMEPGVYLITCTANGLVYVGSSKFMRRRIRQHLNGFRKGNHYNRRLMDDWNKFGAEGFRIEVLWLGAIEELGVKEREFFMKYGVPNPAIGYNRESYPYHPGKNQSPEVVAKRMAMLKEMRKSHPEWNNRVGEGLREYRESTQEPTILVSPDGLRRESARLKMDLCKPCGIPKRTLYGVTGGKIAHYAGWALESTPRTKIYGPNKEEYSFVSSRAFTKWIGVPIPMGRLMSGRAKTWKKWSLDQSLAGEVVKVNKPRGPKTEPKSITLINISTGEKKGFASRGDCARFLVVHKADIYSMIRGRRKTIKGWKL